MNRYKISALLLLLVSTSCLAAPNDTRQPIYISSDTQSLNMKENIVTFTGNVVLKQGTVNIHANKVVVTRPGKSSKQEIIQAYGQPATFHQILDNGKPINGEASTMKYDTSSEFLTMTSNAQLIQEGSKIKGNIITYNIQQQKLMAEGNRKHRVITVLQPGQFSNK
jgi:lipopolysaccharide export system protein LptA